MGKCSVDRCQNCSIKLNNLCQGCSSTNIGFPWNSTKNQKCRILLCGKDSDCTKCKDKKECNKVNEIEMRKLQYQFIYFIKDVLRDVNNFSVIIDNNCSNFILDYMSNQIHCSIKFISASKDKKVFYFNLIVEKNYRN